MELHMYMPCSDLRAYGNEDEPKITSKKKKYVQWYSTTRESPENTKLQQLQLRTQEPLYDS